MDAAPTVPEVEEAEQELTRVPLVLHRRNFSWLTERISGVVEQPAPRWWWVAFAITASTATFGLFCIGYQISTGVGTWGNQIPVGWAWDITNFVFWIGIGHAGTLISAILFLTRQKWRTSINRSAEAMTLFAVICAAIFPGIHVGRVWMAWFLAPVPNSNAIWPNFRSPLLWDVFTMQHVDKMTKIILLTGSIVGYAYLMELFIAWYSGNPFERAAFWNRATGPYWWAYACMMTCNVISPQFFWSKRLRQNLWIV